MDSQEHPLTRSLTESENVREFLDGSVRSFETLRNAGIGLGTYQPGWRWSIHAGPQTGNPSQNHIGYVISGHFRVQEANGSEAVVGPGEAFELAAGSDAWVEGEEPCVALDFLSYKAHNDINP
jgi:quercetin dioxygenase-like cupin family protein